MATIAENLQTIKNSVKNIKQSIINKGGTIEGNLTTYSSAIDSLLPYKVTGIDLNRPTLVLAQGQTLKLVATIKPDCATNKEIIWSSSNNDVATVDNSGQVMGITLGTVTITATSVDNDEVSASCVVSVEALPDTVTISISKYGSATYCSPYILDFSGLEDLKAYAASGYDSLTGEIKFLRVYTPMSSIGLFLTGTPSTSFEVPVIGLTSENVLNLLVGTLQKISINSYSDDGLYVNYRYGVATGDTVPKFYRYADGSTCGAGKAYLRVPLAWLQNSSSSSTLELGNRYETIDDPGLGMVFYEPVTI